MEYYLYANFGPKKKYHIGTQPEEKLWKFSVDIVSLLSFALSVKNMEQVYLDRTKLKKCLKYVKKSPKDLIKSFHYDTRDSNGYSQKCVYVVDLPAKYLSVSDLNKILEMPGYTIRDQQFNEYSSEEMWDIITADCFIVNDDKLDIEEPEVAPKLNLREYYDTYPYVLKWNPYEETKYEFSLDRDGLRIRLNPIFKGKGTVEQC